MSTAPTPSRGWTVVYWIATVYVAATSAVAGAMDLLRLQPFFGILLHLGYPAYFSTILGAWKVLGAAALLAPGRPRLKEWTSAGLFIDFSAALASHLVMGDGGSSLLGPLLSIACLVASSALRPASRRLAPA